MFCCEASILTRIYDGVGVACTTGVDCLRCYIHGTGFKVTVILKRGLFTCDRTLAKVVRGINSGQRISRWQTVKSKTRGTPLEKLFITTGRSCRHVHNVILFRPCGNFRWRMFRRCTCCLSSKNEISGVKRSSCRMYRASSVGGWHTS